jgi:hypothetical protein
MCLKCSALDCKVEHVGHSARLGAVRNDGATVMDILLHSIIELTHVYRVSSTLSIDSPPHALPRFSLLHYIKA